ncbi:hypothetical protein N2152v2_003159 [Parachlorella kessleri]
MVGSAADELPLPELHLGHSLARLRWAVVRQPSVVHLLIGETPYVELVPVAINALPRQVLRKLTLLSQDLPRALPFPAALHNLRTLRVGNSTCTPSWLQQLGSLRQLQQLEMAVELGVGGMEDPAPPRLPAMPALTSLDLTLREGPPFSLCLASLPALRTLALSGEGSAVLEASPDVAGPPGSTTLASVRLCCSDVVAPFSLMPAVRRAEVWVDQLEGAGSIAAATSLTRLQLGGDEAAFCGEPWVPELLRSAPASLRALAVVGSWLAAAATAAGSLVQLRALSVVADAPTLLPPEGAAVWRSLQVLNLDGHDHTRRLPLPEVLRRAAQLKALQVFLSEPTVRDLHLLSLLPSLRHLVIGGMSEGVKAFTAPVVLQLLPQLQTFRTEPASWDELLELAGLPGD